MSWKEVFLSYHHKDKTLAGKIKKRLDTLGFDAFLAHEDIDVSVESNREILRRLESCSVLIAIVTRNFSRSEWTNQEVGIFLGKNKPVVSLVFCSNVDNLCRGSSNRNRPFQLQRAGLKKR